ncbi:MAG: 50S ribosomal protein L25 [Candidatus Anammoxibacter sp.]
MSTYTLPVKPRDKVGSNAVKRLRNSGSIPSILYGHKQENINLSIDKVDLHNALKAKARMVNLKWDNNNENAFVKEVQYDSLGDEIVHVDFTRVDVGEKIKLEIPIELYGEPIGHKKHGVLDHLLKKIEIECEVNSIPEKIRVDVSGLDVNQSVLVKDLQAPESVIIANNPDTIVASVHLVAEEKETTDEDAQAEPEVIAGKKEVEGEEGDEAK